MEGFKTHFKALPEDPHSRATAELIMQEVARGTLVYVFPFKGHNNLILGGDSRGRHFPAATMQKIIQRITTLHSYLIY